MKLGFNILLVAAFCYTSSAQGVFKNAQLRNAKIGQAASSGGGGGGTYALVSHGIMGTNSVDYNFCTIDTSAAKLLVFVVAQGNASGGYNGPTNTGSDVSQLATSAGSSAGLGTNQLYYVTNLTQSSTYVIVVQRNYTVTAAEGFSYTGVTPQFDGATSVGSPSFTSLQPGTLTPTGTELIVSSIAGWGTTSPQTATFPNGWTITDQLLETSTGAFGSIAYTNTTSAQNPSIVSSATTAGGVSAAMFK